MDFLSQITTTSFSLFAFIVMMVLVVGFHEFGHFITARLCGIKVLTFSIGMGKKIIKWRSSRSGIEYVISALPIGGYVKMLDEKDLQEFQSGKYSQEDLNRSFNKAPLWKRFLVVLNGPLFNFILAFLIFFAINLNGVSYPKPIIGSVSDNSWAMNAGLKPNDQILKVGEKDVKKWDGVVFGIIDNIGQENVVFTLLREGKVQVINGSMDGWSLERKDKDILNKLGITPIHSNPSSKVNKVFDDSPAQKYGIEQGDTILKIDNIKINNFADVSGSVRTMPNKMVNVLIDRGGDKIQLLVMIGESSGNPVLGYLGIAPTFPAFNDAWMEVDNMGVIESFTGAIDRTFYMVEITIGFVKKLINGDLSLTLISGPITMADSAGQSASYGLIAFLSFCAMISVNLMIMNLLPIPGLDGGHLFFYLIEAIKGSALSEIIQEYALKAGTVCVVGLMAFAVVMDILDFF